MKRFTEVWAREALQTEPFEGRCGKRIRWGAVGVLVAVGGYAALESKGLKGPSQIAGWSLVASFVGMALFLGFFGRSEALLRRPRLTYVTMAGLVGVGAVCVWAIARSAAVSSWMGLLLATVGIVGNLTPDPSRRVGSDQGHDRGGKHRDDENDTEGSSKAVLEGVAFVALGVATILGLRRRKR